MKKKEQSQKEKNLKTRCLDNATVDGSTPTADLSFLDGLVDCDLGTAEISSETQVAAF